MITFDSEHRLLGIGGTNASGKDTIADALNAAGYMFISTSGWLREYASMYGFTTSRDDLQAFGNKIRLEKGPGGLAEMAIHEYKQRCLGAASVGLVISSIRTAGEIDVLKEHGGTLVFVDAPIEARYQRMMARSRGDENVPLNEFAKKEEFEWHQSDDPGEFSLRTVQQRADILIDNNYSSAEEFVAEAFRKLNIN